MKKRYLLLLIPLLFIQKVNAETISNYQTSYKYVNEKTGTLVSTEYRGAGANVTLNGKEAYSPYYDNWTYPCGYYLYIPKNITSGSNYLVTVTILTQNVELSSFSDYTMNRYKDKNLTHFSAGVINNVSMNYSYSQSYNYGGTQYYQLRIQVQYNITATSNASSFYIGQYASSDQSFGVYEHYLTITYKTDSVNFDLVTDQTIINQNQTIINQNQQIINNSNQTIQKQQETTNAVKDLDDTLKDDDVNVEENGSFFSDFDTQDNGGISSIITAPLVAIQEMLNNQCTPLTATYKGKEMSLPCGTSFWAGLGGIKTFLNVAIGGLLCYRIIVKLFKLIEGFKDPENDKVEVMNL